MTRIIIPVIIAAGFGVIGVTILAQRGARNLAANAPPIASTEAERRILSVLDQARERGQVYLQVPVSSGRMLRVLTETVGAKSVVEIGTSTGYSGLWLCLALVNTGGNLMTFEIDHSRAETARRHFQQAGVAGTVTVIEGDAHVNIKRVNGPVDVVFLDADKEGYVDYLKQLLPVVRPGGLIIADNIEMAPDYEKLITTSPQLETVFSGGMSITLKKLREM
jgi:predicted O-methyltransferase YrrM